MGQGGVSGRVGMNKGERFVSRIVKRKYRLDGSCKELCQWGKHFKDSSGLQSSKLPPTFLIYNGMKWVLVVEIDC